MKNQQNSTSGIFCSSKIALIMVFIAMLFSGCGLFSLGNKKVATFWKEGDRYIVEITCRYLHPDSFKFSPLFIRKEASEYTIQFDLPRIEGEIDGSEIPRKPGYYAIVGKIIIHGDAMQVKLYYDNSDDKKLDALSENGKYTLIERKAKSP